MPEGEELVLERAVEALVDPVVLGHLGPRPVMLKAERLARRIEMPVELTAIVGLYVLDLPVEEEVETRKEVAGGDGAVRRVHPRERDLGVPVDCGQDIALVSLRVAHDGVDAKEEAGDGLPLEFGDLPSRARADALPVHPGLLRRSVIQA